MSSDAAYVHRAQLGDRHAFGVLVDRYRGPVFGLCLHLLGCVDDAQDATQDVFLRACQRIEQLRDPTAFPAWLASIARRECSQRRRQEGGKLVGELQTQAPAVQVTERLERERLASQVRQHLQSLPGETRLIYLLSCLDGLTSERIGAFMGLSAGAVRTRLHRARRRLADALDADGAVASHREAFRELILEVTPMVIGVSNADGPWPEAAFPDDVAHALYACLYSRVPWKEAVRRVAVPEELAEAYLRTWERYLVIERDGDAVRPLVPIVTRHDRPRIQAWQDALARRWTQAATARNDSIEELAQAAAAGGWAATAREALCLFVPSRELHAHLAGRSLYLPPLTRPSGPCHLFGADHGDPGAASNAPKGFSHSFGLSDPQTGDGEYTISAVIWWHCKHSPQVGKFLDRGAPHNPLPRILVSFREDPPTRGAAIQRLTEATQRYFAEGRQPNAAEDMLDRLIGWHVVSADEPHRLLLPAFVGDIGVQARALASEIAGEVAAEAHQGKEALEELIRTSSFAECNRSDVYHLLTADLLMVALRSLIDAGLIPPFPDACFADRGPYIYQRSLWG